MRLWGGDGVGASVVRVRGAAGCGGVRGAVGCVAREGERWDVRAGVWRGRGSGGMCVRVRGVGCGSVHVSMGRSSRAWG